jgi:hypothetical protein
MSYFRVILHGGGISVGSKDKAVLKLAVNSAIDTSPIVGFFTTRIVRALNKDDAVTAAIQLTEKELSDYGFGRINRGNEPQYEIESISELSLWSYLRAKPRRGFTFYSEPSDGDG